jgi:hypothetical protein
VTFQQRFRALLGAVFVALLGAVMIVAPTAFPINVLAMLLRPDLLLVFPRSIGSLFQQAILRKKPKINGISGHFSTAFNRHFSGA